MNVEERKQKALGNKMASQPLPKNHCAVWSSGIYRDTIIGHLPPSECLPMTYGRVRTLQASDQQAVVGSKDKEDVHIRFCDLLFGKSEREISHKGKQECLHLDERETQTDA